MEENIYELNNGVFRLIFIECNPRNYTGGLPLTWGRVAKPTLSSFSSSGASSSSTPKNQAPVCECQLKRDGRSFPKIFRTQKPPKVVKVVALGGRDLFLSRDRNLYEVKGHELLRIILKKINRPIESHTGMYPLL